jgi:hypothetical protein
MPPSHIGRLRPDIRHASHWKLWPGSDEEGLDGGSRASPSSSQPCLIIISITGGVTAAACGFPPCPYKMTMTKQKTQAKLGIVVKMRKRTLPLEE